MVGTTRQRYGCSAGVTPLRLGGSCQSDWVTPVRTGTGGCQRWRLMTGPARRFCASLLSSRRPMSVRPCSGARMQPRTAQVTRASNPQRTMVTRVHDQPLRGTPPCTALVLTQRPPGISVGSADTKRRRVSRWDLGLQEARSNSPIKRSTRSISAVWIKRLRARSRPAVPYEPSSRQRSISRPQSWPRPR
jgi:hypothetical protein